MNIWLRRGLGFLTVGGSALGLSPCMQLLKNPSASVVVLLLAMVFFVWGAVVGVQMFEASGNYIKNNALFWMVQIPLVHSSIFSYSFFNGMEMQLLAQLDPLQFGAYWHMLGGMFVFTLGKISAPTAIGVNVFAVAVSAFLLRHIKS